VTQTATITRGVSVSSTDTPTVSNTQTVTSTNTNTQTNTQTNTLTQTTTQTTTPTNTHTPFQQNLAQPNTPDQPNVSTYIVIGTVMGCLVLMTVVALVVILNNRGRKRLHYTPTLMNTIPTASVLADNPHLSTRSVLSFPPPPPRQA